MKTDAWIRTCFRTFCLATMIARTLAGQTDPGSSQTGGRTPEDSSEKISIKVSVEEVQLDAVVVDGNGRQITDLAADDFEIYQDGKLQKIVSSAYIDEHRKQPDATNKSRSIFNPPMAATPMPDKEKVRQVIVFLIDDLSSRYKQFGPDKEDSDPDYHIVRYARTSIKKFVETQMQPGDLVAILRTGGGTSATQMFSSDKLQLLSIIDHMRWGGIHGFDISNADPGASPPKSERTSGITGIDPFWNRVAFEAASSQESRDVMQRMQMTVFDFQISVIQYCIRAMQAMSGRKSIVFISPITAMPRSLDKASLARLDSVADEALRSGVVIHTLDLGLEDILIRKDLPLSKKTGGIFVRGPSFWNSKSGIGPANELLKGYYLLSYIPPADTFSNRKSDFKSYHQIQIKVKRGKVYSRDGFYGVVNRPDEKIVPARPRSLQDVLYSPFQYTDLKVHMASGYAFFPKLGYFLRAWLHLDLKDLAITNLGNGEHYLSLEVATAITDSKSLDRHSKGLKCDIYVKDEDLPLAKKNGLDFGIYRSFKDLPALYEEARSRGTRFFPDFKFGESGAAYYIRASVRDLVSGKAGSAYQFVEIPNLKKNNLVLSSIFIFNRAEDLDNIKSGNTSNFQPKRSSDWKAAQKSPALRSYLPGETFDYVTLVYNGKPKKSEDPQLDSQIVLLKDGEVCFVGPVEDVSLQGVENMETLPIVKRVVLGKSLETGNYVLQLLVKDKDAKKKERAAAQAIDFEIREGADR